MTDDDKYGLFIGAIVWYTLDKRYYRDGDSGEYELRQMVEIKCVVVNLTSKRVILRKVGDPETVKPFAVKLDKIW